MTTRTRSSRSSSRGKPPTDPVGAYAAAVIAGKIVAGEPVRLACARHLEDLKGGEARGLRFDAAAAKRAIVFSRFLKHSKGEWAGRRFLLRPWQEFIVGSLFGWQLRHGQCPGCDQWVTIGPSDTLDCAGCELTAAAPAKIGWFRRFRVAHIEVARKNGKSTLLAVIGLLLAFFDGEPGAEVYAAATKRDQAKIVWSEARRMVASSAHLRKRIKVFVANLSEDRTGAKFEPLGADGDNLDGLNVHAAIVDEYHAHKTRELYDVLETASAARRQPMMIDITTAGNNRESPCWEQHEHALKVLKGTIDDDRHFAYVATLDEGDDWTDPKVWVKPNPNLGVSVKVDYLAEKIERALAIPSQENVVKQKLLNVWTQQVTRWISLALWDANAGVMIDTAYEEEHLRGRECYGMLDLGAVNDLSAWAMLFPRDDDPEFVDVVARFWCAESRLYDEENRYRDQYQVWAREGWIRTTPGDATDYAFVKADILEDASRFQLVDMNVDRLFQAHQLAMELAEEGITVIGFGMGYYSMAAPMSELMRRLMVKKLHHGGNPVLRWMADNVAVKIDPTGSMKPDKASSQGKIDGIVAIVGALDRAMRHQDSGSVYDDRDIRTI